MQPVDMILAFLERTSIPFQRDVDLRKKTWIKRGGTAAIWAHPDSVSQLMRLSRWCADNHVGFDVVGNTSNLYFLDSYNPTLVVSTLKLTNFRLLKGRIRCEAGCNLARIARECAARGIGGFEGFSGIPGTVAGAAVNNSGCYGSLVENLLDSAIGIENGKLTRIRKEEFQFRNRDSTLKSKQRDIVILCVYFRTSRQGDRAELLRRYDEYKIARQEGQEPKRQNLGSTFCGVDYARLRGLRSRLFWLIFYCCFPFLRNEIAKHRLFAFLTIHLYGGAGIRKYISPYGVHCFVWRDDSADDAFPDYVEFIHRAFNGSQRLEIEIRK